jgi:hypothetical protein
MENMENIQFGSTVFPYYQAMEKKGRPQCIWILAWYEEGIGGVRPFKRATTGLQFDQMSQQGQWQILVVSGYWVSIKFYPWTPLFKLIWNSHT